jgi:hypothetical protein
MLALFLAYGFASLGGARTAEESIAALGLIRSAFEYELTGIRSACDDSLKRSVPLPPDCLEICVDIGNVRLLYAKALEGAAEQCFEILTIMSGVSRGPVPAEVFNGFLVEILRNLLSFDLRMVTGAVLHHFARLCWRLRLSLAEHIRADGYPFQAFLALVAEVSVRSFSCVVHSPAPVQNFLEFWATFERTTDPNVILALHGILASFLESSLKAISEDTEMAAEVFSLTDSASLPRILHLLRPVASSIVPEFSSHILLPIFRTLRDPGPLALFANCVIGMTAGMSFSHTDSDVITLHAVTQLYSVILFEIYENHLTEEYVVNSFVLFVRQFRRLTFISQTSATSQRFYSSFGSLRGVGDAIDFLLRLVWDLLSRLTNPALLCDALEGLSSLLDRQAPFATEAFSAPFVREIVLLRVERPFPFLSLPECGRARSMLHRCLAAILSRPDASALCTTFFATYQLSDDAGIWGFAHDFAGIFAYTRRPAESAPFLAFIFPQLPRLLSLCLQISVSPTTVNAILKLWTAILPGDRISFRRHSADGAILFRHTAGLLTALLDGLSGEFSLTSHLSQRFLVLVLRVLALALSAPYVPFDGLEHFGDSSVPSMVGCLARCAALVPLVDRRRYPKLEKEFVRAAAAVGRHPRAARAAGVVAVATEVLATGARSVAPAVSKCAIDGIRDMATAMPVGEQAAMAVWAVAIKNGKISDDAAACLATVARADRSALEMALTRVRQAALEEREAEVAEACEAVVSALTEAIAQGDAQAAISAVQRFVAVVRGGAIKKPETLFNDLTPPCIAGVNQSWLVPEGLPT